MDEPESRRQLPRLKGALSVAGSRAWITLLRRSTARWRRRVCGTPRSDPRQAAAGRDGWMERERETVVSLPSSTDHLDHRWLFLQRDQVKVVPGLL
ncbi:hypothetical protein AGIG_G8507 [Arapaima gigas]